MTGPDSHDSDAGGYDPAGYGDTHADVYDRIYPVFPTHSPSPASPP